MKNVREGIVNDSVRLLTTRKNPNGLMMGEATKETIDQRILPGKASKVVAEGTPLVDPRYEGNVLVSAASAAAGFDVTQTPPVDAVIEPVISTPTKESEIPEIVPVSISIPPVKEEPVVESVEQVATGPQVSQVINEQPVDTNAIPSIDPVINAINQELVKPQPQVKDEAPVALKTPAEFSEAEAPRESQVDYVNLIEKIIGMQKLFLIELEKAKELSNEKYDALIKKVREEMDNLVRDVEKYREAEKLRENKPNFAPVREALDNQSQVFNQYSQGLENVR